MAKPKPSPSGSINPPDTTSLMEKLSRLSNASYVTTDVEKDLTRLCMLLASSTKTKTNREQLLRDLQSAMEALAENMAKTKYDSLQQETMISSCAKIMSNAVATKHVDTVKVLLINLEKWLTSDSISEIAVACQTFGWSSMRET